jgi:hypothetical protein
VAEKDDLRESVLELVEKGAWFFCACNSLHFLMYVAF